MTTNCPNCGAPIDRSRDSCEYCGTPYEKSNDIHIEVTAPEPNIDDFIESLSRMSRCAGFNLMGSTSKSIQAFQQDTYSQVRASIQTTQQELLSGMASSTAWKPTPEEERKMIEDMRNIAPMIFPEAKPPTVEYIKYNTKLERLMDTVWFLFVAMIATILCSLLPFIIF